MIRTVVYTFSIAGIVAGLALTGCKKEAPAPGATAEPTSMNTVCPMDGNPVLADAGTAEFAGQTIGFCSAGCAEHWATTTDVEKTSMIEKLGNAAEEAGEAIEGAGEDLLHEAEEHPTGDHPAGDHPTGGGG